MNDSMAQPRAELAPLDLPGWKSALNWLAAILIGLLFLVSGLWKITDVQQAAVIGIPDARLGEVGMAFVVRRPGSTLTTDDIVGWSREQMANYKAPRAVFLVDTLPLNANGKVDKRELRLNATSSGRTPSHR